MLMTKDTEWITARVAEARQLHASVTEAVSLRIAELLTGPLIEGQLSTTDLAKVASALITDMVPGPPTPKAKP